MNETTGMRVAVLGAGKLGGILLRAFVRSGLVAANNIVATVKHEERAAELSEKFGVAVTTDNLSAARGADVIVLGVKPWQIAALVAEIAPALTSKQMLVSIAAGITTRAIEDAAGCELAVVRAMPNTPAQLSAGVTALCAGRFVSLEQLIVTQKIFATVGVTVVVDEAQMDAVTGVSGSGPAFLYLVIDALAEGGVAMGLSREVATTLAAQTALGAARMVLEAGRTPAELVAMVTTPNGTTVAGIKALEEGHLRETLVDAVKRATERAKELAG